MTAGQRKSAVNMKRASMTMRDLSALRLTDDEQNEVEQIKVRETAEKMQQQQQQNAYNP